MSLLELFAPIFLTRSLSWLKSEKPDISSKLAFSEVEVELVETKGVEVGETGLKEAE